MPIGLQPLVDFHIDDTHNYKAAGVYHHNCGKTFCHAAELAYHLTGRYPDWWDGRRWPFPIVAWASSETGESTRDNPQRALLGLVGEYGTGAIPSDCLPLENSGRGYGKATGTADLYDFVKVRHVSGGWSTLRFKYYAQGRRKWQGPPVHEVWFDEEPPEEIYDEGLARTIATKGGVSLTFTPLLGMSNVVRRFLMEHSPDRHDTNMTIEDAEHIAREERARIIASFPAHEREARANGVPTLGSGLIFPVTDESITVDPFAIPDHWPQIYGIDFGWDHPTAMVKLAWDRDNDVVYVTRCYRQREQPVAIHAASVPPQDRWIPVAWPHDGNNDTAAGVHLASQYSNAGLNMLPEHAQFDEEQDDTARSGISVEAGLAEMLDRMLTGRWRVFSHCAEWLEERRLYHRKNGRIVKEMDDAISASRYAMMMLRFAITKPSHQQRLDHGRRGNWRA